jgi:hypothetical protein
MYCSTFRQCILLARVMSAPPPPPHTYNPSSEKAEMIWFLCHCYLSYNFQNRLNTKMQYASAVSVFKVAELILCLCFLAFLVYTTISKIHWYLYYT